ncbi:MAG TPA: Spy/CpxP family protein refolding chaperone [Acetobacteraceae bacterium]
MNSTLAPKVAPALLLSTVLLAGAAVPAMAQSYGNSSYGNNSFGGNQSINSHYPSTAPSEQVTPQSSQGWSIEQMARERLGRLQDTLRINAGQQQAWNQFANTSLQNATTLDQLYRQRRDTLQTMNAVQNMQTFTQIQLQQAQGMERLLPTFQQLYAELSPQQRQAADDMFRNYAERAPARVSQR